MTVEVLRYAVFPRNGRGGLPAGVVLGADWLPDAQMSAVAQAMGCSATAFLLGAGRGGDGLRLRCFSPRGEVPSCDHATIATAVAYATRHGTGSLPLQTASGSIVVDTEERDGGITASLTSTPPTTRPIAPLVLQRLLDTLQWNGSDLHSGYPPHLAVGQDAILLGVASEAVLARLGDGPAIPERHGSQQGPARLHAFWPETEATFHARTGLARGEDVDDVACSATAFGGYLRTLGQVAPGGEVTLLRDRGAGAPSRILVQLGQDPHAVRVGGAATALPLSVYDDQEPR